MYTASPLNNFTAVAIPAFIFVPPPALKSSINPSKVEYVGFVNILVVETSSSNFTSVIVISSLPLLSIISLTKVFAESFKACIRESASQKKSSSSPCSTHQSILPDSSSTNTIFLSASFFISTVHSTSTILLSATAPSIISVYTFEPAVTLLPTVTS